MSPTAQSGHSLRIEFECPLLAEAVEKLRRVGSQSNNGIGSATSVNHCCSARRHHESMLRLGALNIVFNSLSHMRTFAKIKRKILEYIQAEAQI